MLLRRTSTKPAKRKASGGFALFKPLFAVAICVILFEMLPIDFQHHLAPALVSYEEVFFASRVDDEFAMTHDDLLQDRLVARQGDTVVEISIN